MADTCSERRRTSVAVGRFAMCSIRRVRRSISRCARRPSLQPTVTTSVNASLRVPASTGPETRLSTASNACRHSGLPAIGCVLAVAAEEVMRLDPLLGDHGGAERELAAKHGGGDDLGELL